MKQKKRPFGFTLIELLVVIAIIALLLAIITPGLKSAKDTAKRVTCGTRLKQIGTAMKMYSDAFDGLLPDDQNITKDSRERHAYTVYRNDPGYVYLNGKLKPLRFAYLYELNYIEVPEIFYCPGNIMDLYKYESYIKPTAWGTLPQDYNANTSNQWVRIGYTYYPVELNAPIDPLSQAPRELAKKYIRLNPNLPYATDVLHGRSNLSHKTKVRYSANALFADGHVTFCNDQDVFLHSIWDPFDTNTISDMRYYDTFYYTVFRMIRP
jgi:prepilin-type N-terminal cleavage/methylation domain-containing protein/prepilin-type processing-associated H-X9-DG protein